jgi:precorrin-6A/cobalt-precorrin-6A reductase
MKPMPNPPRKAKRVLILGGTGEARELAQAIADRFGEAVEVINSLAGRTETPGVLAGTVRIGGFDGADGLRSYLREQAIDLLIDATHPFATRISHNAAAAADQASVPRLMLIRPPWPRHPLDRWIEVGDVSDAARILPRVGKRAFLTLGSAELSAFHALTDTFFLIRTVDEPKARLPLADYQLMTGKGPFDLAMERQILTHHRIDVVVSKASGGEATAAKLIAAREASLPVIMITRPLPPAGERVDTVAEAVAWLAARLGL